MVARTSAWLLGRRDGGRNAGGDGLTAVEPIATNKPVRDSAGGRVLFTEHWHPRAVELSESCLSLGEPFQGVLSPGALHEFGPIRVTRGCQAEPPKRAGLRALVRRG